MPPQFNVPTPPNINLSDMQRINPQQLQAGFGVLDQFRLGGAPGGSGSLSNAFNPNEQSSQDRSALQALNSYEQALKTQGGTRGNDLTRQLAETKGASVLGGLAGGAGGAAGGFALGTAAAPFFGPLAPVAPLIGGLAGALFGGKGGSTAAKSALSFTGPGQFESTRENTANTISAATGLPIDTVLSSLPDYGEDPGLAQNKLNSLKSILASRYAGGLNPASMNMPGQQSFGGVTPNLSSLSTSYNQGMNQGLNNIKAPSPSAGVPLSDMEEALAL